MEGAGEERVDAIPDEGTRTPYKYQMRKKGDPETLLQGSGGVSTVECKSPLELKFTEFSR